MHLCIYISSNTATSEEQEKNINEKAKKIQTLERSWKNRPLL